MADYTRSKQITVHISQALYDDVRHEFLNHFIDKSDIDMILEIEGG